METLVQYIPRWYSGSWRTYKYDATKTDGGKTDVTPEEKFNRIIEDALCIGCGLCQSVATPVKIQVAKAKSGELRPRVVAPLSNEDIENIYATCPGTRIEGLPPFAIKAAAHHDLVWGPYHRLVLGWASTPKVRHEGSTGGVLTALGQYLLRSGRVKFILHVKASETEPTFGEATLSFTEAEVFEGAGSRYGPAAPLSDLEGALTRNEPFALIAKPCDLNAVRNLAHIDPRVNRLIRYWLTPVCGGYMPDQAMNRFLNEQGVKREDVTELRYRGRGCPGPTTIKTKDGDQHDVHYLDVWGEDESTWSLPFRCKICPDGIGEGADIAAADTWPDACPDREASLTDPGTNSLIVRTAPGMELLDAAVRDGALVLGNDVDIAYLNDTQPHQVTKKRFVKARYDGLQDAGALIPKAVNLRVNELSEANDARKNEEQRQGAFERASAGKQKETRN